MVHYIILVFVLIFYPVFAQNSISEPKDGFPPHIKDRNKANFAPAYYYEIRSDSLFEYFYIIHKGGNKKTHENFWLFYQLKNSYGDNFTSISFNKIPSGYFYSEAKFKTLEEDKISPLKIKLDTTNAEISYMWGNSTRPKIIDFYKYKVNSFFPDIVLYNSSGKKMLSDIKDKPIVINLWSTTCLPCIAEMPGLNKLVNKYNNVEFVSIIYDDQNLDSFLEKHEFLFTHYYTNMEIQDICGNIFPRNIVLNTERKIILNKLGGNKDMYINIEKALLSINN